MMKLCEDSSSSKDDLIDGEAVCNKNNIIGEGDEESNDESDDRCGEVSPAEEPTHSSSSRQLMEFSPREHKLPTKRIFDYMKTRLAKKKAWVHLLLRRKVGTWLSEDWTLRI